MYGVGYPVMVMVLTGHEVLWLIALLMLGKIFASSLTMGIGGSGGVFAPSLFTGAMMGTAFGDIARHFFGASIGSPAIYGIVAMGAVFSAASQAPLTSIASVVEMTGNFGLALPVMLAVGIATGISKRLTYGTIYTTKLLRRGIDIDRPRAATAIQHLRVTDVMQPLPSPCVVLERSSADDFEDPKQALITHGSPTLLGERIITRQPQVLFADETLENALRQLALYGPDGLPVISNDQTRIEFEPRQRKPSKEYGRSNSLASCLTTTQSILQTRSPAT
jgi:CIC family chloride channel protein